MGLFKLNFENFERAVQSIRKSTQVIQHSIHFYEDEKQIWLYLPTSDFMYFTIVKKDSIQDLKIWKGEYLPKEHSVELEEKYIY